MASRVYRNKAIGKHIREEFVCCITEQPYPVNHHLIGCGYSGMGTKSPDYLQMALCDSLHRELHDKGWKSFEKKYGRTQKNMVAEIEEFSLPDWLYTELSELTKQ
jgi:hypothetical protein